MSDRSDNAAALRGSRRALLVALGIDNFGSGLFLPLALIYVTRVVGLPLGVAGSTVALGTAIGLLVPPLAGRLVDRIGPRTVVIAAQLLQAAGALGYLFARGLPLTVVAALLLAAGQQLFYSSLFALIADVSEQGPKDRPFAVVAMVRSATFGLGALVAGVFLIGADDLGLRVAVGVDALSFLFAALLLLFAVRLPHHGPEPAEDQRNVEMRRVLRDPPYLALIGITGLVALVTDFFLIGIPVYMLDELDAPSWLPAAMLALLTVMTSLGATVVLRATSHLTRTTAMAIGAALYALWCAVSLATVAVPDPWRPAWLLASTVILAAGTLMFSARANALAEAAAPRPSRGRYLAAFQYAFTVAGVLAPAVVALFTLGIWVPWVLVAAAACLGILGLRWLGPRLPTDAIGVRHGVAP